MFTYTQTASHTHTHKRPHTVTRTQTNTHGDAQGSTHLDRVHYTCKTLFYYMSTLTSTNDAIHIHYFCTRAHKYHHSYAHSCIAPSHIYTHSHMYANSQFTRIHSYPETPSFLITPLLTHAHPHTHTGLLVSYHYYDPGGGWGVLDRVDVRPSIWRHRRVASIWRGSSRRRGQTSRYTSGAGGSCN